MSHAVTDLLSAAGGTVPLRRIEFVPAQFPDVPSLPEGVHFTRLNAPLQV